MSYELQYSLTTLYFWVITAVCPFVMGAGVGIVIGCHITDGEEEE